jgi:hypothetical protein
LRSEGGKVTKSILLKCAAEERSGTFRLNVVFGGLHYAEILITWGELCLGEYFEVSVGSLA